MSLFFWPLISFTLLMQMSVGSFVFSESLSLFFSRRFHPEGLRLLRLFSRSLVLFVSLVSVALSLFHLAKPVRAHLVLNNLASSWLSREILLVLVFSLIVLASLILEWRKVRGQRFQSILYILGSLSGLLLIGAMSRVYMLSTVPAWNYFLTPMMFFLVCFLLGGQLTAASWSFYFHRSKSPLLKDIHLRWKGHTLRRVERVSFVLIVFVVFSTAPLFFQPVFQSISWVLGIRLLLSLTGAIILGWQWIPSQSLQTDRRTSASTVYIVFYLVLSAEILGRCVFYAGYSRLGL